MEMNASEEPRAETVLLDVAGGKAVVTIDNPRRRNMMTLAMREVFHDHLAAALADPAVRVVILAGRDGNFCAGADITGMNETGVEARERLKRLHRIVRLIAFSEKPVITVAEGFVAGNGLSIAAASDFTVADPEARFICSFVRLGLVPDTGALWFLPQRMGLGRARLAMMAAEPIVGPEAVASGLADILSQPGKALEEAHALADRLMKAGPLAIGMTKALLARNPQSLDEALKAETDAQAVLFTSQDFQEGRKAFLEKRPARFEGR
jgi:2-(1,2-epoxy-1,2-dihydrophenyl)acetyl-CoA isomerase